MEEASLNNRVAGAWLGTVVSLDAADVSRQVHLLMLRVGPGALWCLWPQRSVPLTEQTGAPAFYFITQGETLILGVFLW